MAQEALQLLGATTTVLPMRQKVTKPVDLVDWQTQQKLAGVNLNSQECQDSGRAFHLVVGDGYSHVVEDSLNL